MCIAEREVERPVIRVGPGLRHDLDPSAPRTLELRRVRILIDFHLLDRRRRDADSARFHAVHDQRDPAARGRARVEEPRQRPDDVAVEDRKVLQRLVVNDDCVAVRRRRGRDRRRFADGDRLVDGGELEHDFRQRDAAAAADADVKGRRFEPLENRHHIVCAGGDTLEDERARGIRRRLAADGAGRVGDRDAHTRHHRPRLILNRPAQR